MITENLSTLKIHKLTQEQYDCELAAGRIDANALYLTPDEKDPQPNWSQNDTSALDYIKNRTHYTEVSQKTRRFRPMDDYGFIEDLQFAEELYVNMQNAEYFINRLKCEYAGSGSDNSYNVVQHHENGDVYWLIEIEGAPNGETGVFDLTGVIKITPDFTDNSELEPLLRFENASIRIVRETVHKLDEKYIPDDFAKTADLENYATTSQLSSLRTDVNKKMMQNNPMGLGSFSMNGSGLVGERAVEVNSGN